MQNNQKWLLKMCSRLVCKHSRTCGVSEASKAFCLTVCDSLLYGHGIATKSCWAFSGLLNHFKRHCSPRNYLNVSTVCNVFRYLLPCVSQACMIFTQVSQRWCRVCFHNIRHNQLIQSLLHVRSLNTLSKLCKQKRPIYQEWNNYQHT